MNVIPSFRNTHIGLVSADRILCSEGSHEKVQSKCDKWFARTVGCAKARFTKSCTQSLELAVASLRLPPGSEIIIPSYGFVSLANAVAMFGNKCVFVDCDEDTLNLSYDGVISATTAATKAIITINYAGTPCDYEQLVPFCEERGIILIEDNAHGLLASMNGRALGTFGNIATFSFDSLKMITCYEGGAIVSSDERLWQNIKTACDMGTNRDAFLDGSVPYYEWKALGTNAALALPLYEILNPQFDDSDKIKQAFVNAWNHYADCLSDILREVGVRSSVIPVGLDHNGYIFWIMTRSAEERLQLQRFMADRHITVNPHYSALHRSEFGKKYHSSSRPLPNSERAATCMLRLPLFYGISTEEQNRVIEGLRLFYQIDKA